MSTGKYMVIKNIFMVVTAALGILIVRYLGPYEYGKYSLVWQLIGTIGPILSLGWLTTLSRFIPEKNTTEEKANIFSQSLFSVMFVGLIAGTGFLLVSSLFPNIIPIEIREIKIYFIIFIVITALFNISEGMYRGLGKFNRFSIIDGLRSNFGSILAIVLVIYGFRTFKTIVFSNFAFSAIFITAILIFLKDYIRKPSIKVDPLIAKFSLTLFVGQILFLLMTSIDFVLLRALLKDPSQIGFYNAGIKIPNLIQTALITPLSIPFLYYFSHPDVLQTREKMLETGTRLLGVIFGCVALLIFSFSKEAILLLLGKNYIESIQVLRFSALSLFIIGYVTLFAPYFTSINKPGRLLLTQCVTFTSILLSNLLLIPVLKSVGPTIGGLIGLFIQTIILLLILPYNRKQCLYTFTLLSFTLAVSVATGFFISYYLTVPVYLILVYTTKTLTINDIKTLKGLLVK